MHPLPVVLLAVALGAGAGGCDARPERIVLGIALTESNHEAVRLAAREINDAGGISGALLELAGLDWQFAAGASSEEILEWADRFASTPELLAIVGHSDSGSTLAGAAVYNERGLPQIVTIATHPAITNIGEWTYRICLSDAYQGPALAEYAVNDWGKRRIAVFHVNDDYGRGLAQEFERRATELGAEVVATAVHHDTLGADDKAVIGNVLERLRGDDSEPDVFLLIQRLEAGLWTVGAIREAGFSTDILGADNFGAPEFARSDGSTEGVRTSHFFLPASGNARATRFVEEFTRFAGREPNYGDAFAYDAVYLFRDAAAGGGLSRAGVKRYLDELIAGRTTIEGVTGSYVLGGDHDARRPLSIAAVRDGTFELVNEVRIR